ncbi:TonB-dependent siderophore receptor [Pseudomonas cannabina pv. alisalensis]|uniref:TonB-dependent siderophore receptor n=1 Tax=Pseudomonas cannabina TaxID=86840 RepID=A0A3M3Q0E3_PSECA|nr:TonB-dependent siderophore receptor [Pseudomonas cannabina pv. alisalensis]RMN77203.1 TonB-dependent siderophore receptor [Pseudomonas cannabina]RMN80877.1 TonB-dependent siderophore receptor [Pseudomonas cannabina pv. alisalensis]RMN88350.1 TonB-dependent siderophore receptor [Pseudomonas cannabina]
MHSPLRLRPAAVMVKLALACLAVGHAQAAEPANVLSLDDVVVTASGFEQNLEDAPASMTVITGDELRKKSFYDQNARGRARLRGGRIM